MSVNIKKENKTAYKSGKDMILPDAANFSPPETLDCGQAFKFLRDGDVWRGVVMGRLLQISVRCNDIVFHNMTQDEFDNIFYRYFTLDVDYGELFNRFSADETMKKACQFAPGIRLLRQEPWEALCSFIISQNNNIPRIKGIIARLCENFGDEIQNGFYTFPSAERLAVLNINELDVLRAGFRSKYILDAAKKVSSGELNLKELEYLPLDTARTKLISVKGVGPKVAECALLYGCGRFDAFPEDVWIKRVMKELYPNGLPECVKGYEGIAQQYLFHYIRNIKGVK